MNIEPPPDTEETRAVAAQATAEIARKWKARQRIPAGWLGFGAMGLIGWTIVLPMLLGVTLGHWLDEHHPAGFSWMFALPMAALTIGSVNAAYWAYAGRRAAASLPE
jgi:ATP synthase protein I